MSGPADSKRNSLNNIPMTLFWSCLTMGVAVGLFVLLLPPESSHRLPAKRTECKNNLKQLGLALHNYHDQYGSLPPAYVADANGRPLYSWRVLLLPMLEQQNLYKDFRLNEPWDSPHNIKLSNRDLEAFRCASDPNSRPGCTNYVVVTGAGTAFDGTKPRTFNEMKDGLSQTLFIVEVADSNFRWAEPRDLSLDTMNLTINAEQQGFSSHHAGGAQALLGDGSVRMLENKLPPQTLRTLLTISGGENISEF